MAASAAARKAAAKAKPPTRRDLCQELLDIARKPEIAEALSRMEAIKSLLKEQSKTDGKFREEFPGIGFVSASPPTPSQVNGEEPKLSIAAWMAARESQRTKLLEQGIVTIEPIIKAAFYGRVEVKLHTPAGS